MNGGGAERSRPTPELVRWPTVAVAAAVSVLSSPITAIWFLWLAPVVMAGTVVVAMAVRSDAQRLRAVRGGLSAGLGLLAGPVAYLGLALVV